MAQQNLDFGSIGVDDGEFLETGMPKVQANFDELYAALSTLKGSKEISGTSYTPDLTDDGLLLEFTNIGDVTVTLPSDSTYNHPLLTVITGRQAGAGQVISVADTNVTIYAAEGNTALKTKEQNAGIQWVKLASNIWWVIGGVS